MCGVLAYSSNKERYQAQRFHAALEKLAHRGPDASDRWVSDDQQVALGHRLLHLTGKRPSPQPISNEDGTIHAIVNGEFYQYEQLREELESRSHHFKSDSDSELLVHLYEDYGIHALNKLNGEFAFALWDSRSEQLFCARDRFGIKPLHYHLQNETLIVASEAKALLTYGISARWNQQALERALTHQYLAPCESLFADIKQLPPAHFLVFAQGKLTLENYWQPQRSEDEGDPIELINRLKKAVSQRYHPQAAFSLSGGIDSSAVVALASQERGHSVPAFTVCFDEERYNEGPLVQDNEITLGAQVNPVVVSRQDLLEGLASAVTASEGLAINGQMVGKYRLNQTIHQAGFRAVISGEGADEALLGYSHLLADYNPESTPVHPLQKGIMLPSTPCSISSPLPAWLKKWPSFLSAKVAFCNELSPLLAADFQNQLATKERLSETMELLYSAGYMTAHDDTPHQSAAIWTRLALSNAILKTLGDGCEMPHSVEGRAPFLDREFFEYAWSLPLHQKLSGSRTKVIFREAATQLLPAALAQREKHPFLAPPLLSEKKNIPLLLELLESSLLREVTFLDQTKILTWFNRISQASPDERQRTDPALHLILSCLHLQKSYSLTL